MQLHAREELTIEWDFFQGDRSEDFGVNEDLADSDARVRKCLQNTATVHLPTLGGATTWCPVKANLRSPERPMAS